MATTDNNVQYDKIYFNEFFHRLEYNFDQHQMDAICKLVDDGLLQRDRMMELAISKISGLAMSSVTGQDHEDGSDVKTVVSSMRNNIKPKETPKTKEQLLGLWTNSFNIRNVAGKNGAIRAILYNKLLNKFQYLYIPHKDYQHITSVIEVILERYYGKDEPQWTGYSNVRCKWLDKKYVCNSIEELAKRTD